MRIEMGSSLMCFPWIDRDRVYNSKWMADEMGYMYQYETASSSSSNRYAKPIERVASGSGFHRGNGYGGGIASIE